ncbi:Rpn family recombination-promoting nuclease/putative transposase, partial [Deltaproteobacteria bacterium TL4]
MKKPTQDTIHNPHDKLFKTVFSDTKEAASFLQSYLPSDVVEKLNWNSLGLIDKAFIDEEFQASESDLLFQVETQNTQREVFVYLLFEHQSSPDKWVRFRLLKYMCRIWDNSFKEHPDQQTLKAIIPVVFYQGKSVWTASTEFLDLVEHEGFNAVFIPQFAHFLMDQSGYGLEDFKGEIKAQIAQLLLRTSFHGQIKKALRRFVRLLTQMEANEGIDYEIFFMIYLMNIEGVSVQEVQQTITQEAHSQKLGEKIMNAAEQLRIEGEQRGLQKGRQEGRQEGLEKGDLIGQVRAFQLILKQARNSKEA